MRQAGREQRLAALRRSLGGLEAGRGEPPPVLAFGVGPIDRHLPGGGLRRGALHEIVEASANDAQAALATLFAASLVARLPGPVLWCLASRDLFAPGLAAVGLHPDRVLYAETWRDAEVLPAMEEGLRQRGLAAVVGELSRLGLTASRRLHLAAAGSGGFALALRRGRAEAEPEPSAAFTRWRIRPAPSPSPPGPGLLRARWTVELLRARGAAPQTWIVEAPDAKGRLRLPADLADRPLAPAARRAAPG
ncbi:Protein ImuA [Methylobacterium crusticola]|uniref:Protein ImuA n=1 Tax=Methylobacterium crusticola TaxID=1697972 RepID=A0ABQ4R887_9HYPH|nr:damage-inducible mutagenesis protein [Methylobacterium crusticola]GJD53334.1 Protein ImuA [Methylobacterium crusticola]